MHDLSGLCGPTLTYAWPMRTAHVLAVVCAAVPLAARWAVVAGGTEKRKMAGQFTETPVLWARFLSTECGCGPSEGLFATSRARNAHSLGPFPQLPF